MDLAAYLRIQAHANRLANLRLHRAMAPLTRAELHAPRTSFFPSLAETLNHILAVDRYYIAALRADADPQAQWHGYVPFEELAPLAAAQAQNDERLIDFCRHLDAAGCERIVPMPRAAGRIQHERACHVLAHLLNHQVHHRGQLHAMLSGTAVAPPQLDEFMMPSEGELRGGEMAALGWSEAAVYGTPPVAPRAIPQERS